MRGVLSAYGAILFEFKTVGIVALILKAVIITVMTLGALERDFHSRGFGSHYKTPYKKITPRFGCVRRV